MVFWISTVVTYHYPLLEIITNEDEILLSYSQLKWWVPCFLCIPYWNWWIEITCRRSREADNLIEKQFYFCLWEHLKTMLDSKWLKIWNTVIEHNRCLFGSDLISELHHGYWEGPSSLKQGSFFFSYSDPALARCDGCPH